MPEIAVEPAGGGNARQYPAGAGGRRVRARKMAQPAARRSPLFAGARAALALASVLALVVTGLVLERPAPRMA